MWKSSPSGFLPGVLIGFAALQLAFFQWPKSWLLSGSPALSIILLQGEANGTRVLPFAHIWTLLATINLVYAVASTSWLLYWVFAAACYGAIYITCLFQFSFVGALTRHIMRLALRQMHFIDDKIALFDIPALEIDTEVHGLMVLRGATFSLTKMSLQVHGVELGIKLSEEIELAIQCEIVTVSLFRGIQVGDCFANLKGGETEMTLTDALFAQTPATEADEPKLAEMKSKMTDGRAPQDSSRETAIESMKWYSLQENSATGRYTQLLKTIDDTNAIRQCREHVQAESDDEIDEHALRAAICSELHSKPSVPHPPRRSIKVTTLQGSTPERIRNILHRLPLLLRLLLSPIAYFHPVKISSITATASGKWIETSLVQQVFKHYGESDSDLQNLKNRMSAWVGDANFAVELDNITGNAQVPVVSLYNIICQLAFGDVQAFRTLPKEVSLNRVLKLSGMDATFVVPSFLLPHHEHLLPAVPTKDEAEVVAEEADDESASDTDERVPKDEAIVQLQARAHLPAILDQELLDFVAMIVKAFKLAEIEETLEEMDKEENKFAALTGVLNQKIKGGMKKAMMVSDQWVSKLVGKVLRKLEVVHGDLGYTAEIPVPLQPYRETGWLEVEGDKVLP